MKENNFQQEEEQAQREVGTTVIYAAPFNTNNPIRSQRVITDRHQQLNTSQNKINPQHNQHHHAHQDKNTDEFSLSGTIIGEHFKLLEKLGNGAFGVIYKTIDLQSENSFYACKVEKAGVKHPQIIFEEKIYKYLHNSLNKPAVGFPKCYFFSQSSDYNIMVMELLGSSLESLFCQCGKKFSLKTVLMLADQMLQRTEYLHNRAFIHRDIKPDNFLMGVRKRENRVYMIDFGLAKRYWKDNQHISIKEGKNLTGTARYASINTHVGIEQSRRDDLESLAYVLLYFLKGQLPWQNTNARDKKEKYEKIKLKKQSVTSDELCAGTPSEFKWFLNYSKGLDFIEKPDYSYCRQIFKELMIKNQFTYDNNWDWNLLEYQPPSSMEISSANLENIPRKKISSQQQQHQQHQQQSQLQQKSISKDHQHQIMLNGGGGIGMNSSKYIRQKSEDNMIDCSKDNLRTFQPRKNNQKLQKQQQLLQKQQQFLQQQQAQLQEEQQLQFQQYQQQQGTEAAAFRQKSPMKYPQYQEQLTTQLFSQQYSHIPPNNQLQQSDNKQQYYYFKYFSLSNVFTIFLFGKEIIIMMGVQRIQ